MAKNTMGGIDSEKELAALEPSKDLLNFYREKISQFDQNHNVLLKHLQKYKTDLDSGIFEKEREQLRSEVIDLRGALSDVNVFLHSERQQVQHLHHQNERLKLDLLESNKKVALLMSLSGINEHELKGFLRAPKNLAMIKQRLDPHLKKLHEKIQNIANDRDVSEREAVLQKKIESLESQVKTCEQDRISERAVLLQDRSLCIEEAKTQQNKDETYINLLTSRIQEVKYTTHELNETLIKTMAQHEEEEKKWLAEKDQLLSHIWKTREHNNFAQLHEKLERSGSYTDLALLKDSKPTCQLKELKRNNSQLKKLLHDAEELKLLYLSQNRSLERELCLQREQSEAKDVLLKEKKVKHSSQTKHLQSQIEKLNFRLKKEASGFHAELKILKNNLRSVIQQVYKIIKVFSMQSEVNPKMVSIEDSKAVADLSRAVQLAINDMKRHVTKLENNLRPENEEE